VKHKVSHPVKIIEDPVDPDDHEPKSYDVPIWAWVVIAFGVIVVTLAVIVWVDRG
jgi:hypothetical protein